MKNDDTAVGTNDCEQNRASRLAIIATGCLEPRAQQLLVD